MIRTKFRVTTLVGVMAASLLTSSNEFGAAITAHSKANPTRIAFDSLGLSGTARYYARDRPNVRNECAIPAAASFTATVRADVTARISRENMRAVLRRCNGASVERSMRAVFRLCTHGTRVRFRNSRAHDRSRIVQRVRSARVCVRRGRWACTLRRRGAGALTHESGKKPAARLHLAAVACPETASRTVWGAGNSRRAPCFEGAGPGRGSPI